MGPPNTSKQKLTTCVLFSVLLHQKAAQGAAKNLPLTKAALTFFPGGSLSRQALENNSEYIPGYILLYELAGRIREPPNITSRDPTMRFVF